MARHERNIADAGAEPLSIDELLEILDATDRSIADPRQLAVARYLSGAEGWQYAVKQLGGAFADSEAKLSERKSD